MGIVFSNIIAIYRRELQSYFVSPLAYAIAGIFWFLAGCLFLMTLQGAFEEAANADSQGIPIDVAYLFVRDFLGGMWWLELFILPILSMGLYAEERKRGTLELLATSPVTNWAVAVGKLLGVLTFFTAMVIPMVIFEAMIFGAANPPVPMGIIFLGHLALILLAGAILSIGMFISSLTESTIFSAFLTFAIISLLFIIYFAGKAIGGFFGDFLVHLSLLHHYGNLIQGIFNTSSLILFISYIVLGIFLTAQSIDALRFQRQ
jgi:ABC-2 type transport system permease protein